MTAESTGAFFANLIAVLVGFGTLLSALLSLKARMSNDAKAAEIAAAARLDLAKLTHDAVNSNHQAQTAQLTEANAQLVTANETILALSVRFTAALAEIARLRSDPTGAPKPPSMFPPPDPIV